MGIHSSITIILLFCFNVLYAQVAPSIEWQKCLGGSGFDYSQYVLQTSDEGYVVAGTTYSSDGDVSESLGGADCWLVKLDEAGNLDWQKSFGGSDDDYLNS